ncbi:hypothetical protein CPB83DRAFT_870512 [Crepidotus variabilis]|uniref:Uncharacterized protein n=1 Tax=Crepidotus variabilis TaxID=179855 RepID=A0A9P6EBE6_9AGAR|nr:hypothetical protein CPB83DRAFT_870512 [Crepidotus variabilis]
MHLFCLNMGDLLIPLWRGDPKMCVAPDNVASWDWACLKGENWEEFGQRVAESTKYFPSSFHQPPRNPVEKISSGYKATEFYLLLFGLGPAFLRPILPEKYWKNFCKLVRGVRTVMQRRITLAQVKDARVFLSQFVEEFENLYYQRRMDRLQFTRPVLHSTLHVAPEISRVGNGSNISQYTMERMIGNLGQGIRQPSNPFANLCHLALRKSQLNALKVIYPELDHHSQDSLPRYSVNVGGGYIFLRPRDRRARGWDLNDPQLLAIQNSDFCNSARYQRWGRLRLPNFQVARSLFSESQRPSKRQQNARVTRNLIIDGTVEYGEIQFYFLDDGRPSSTSGSSSSGQSVKSKDPNEDSTPLALVLLYKRPDAEILRESLETLWACKRGSNEDYCIVSITSIISVVSIQPLPSAEERESREMWFVVEKSGLEDLECLSGQSIDDIFE